MTQGRSARLSLSKGGPVIGGRESPVGDKDKDVLPVFFDDGAELFALAMSGGGTPPRIAAGFEFGGIGAQRGLAEAVSAAADGARLAQPLLNPRRE
ncbi:MAG: hypothetical protein ACREE4_23055, partial [Stellaceae bacterium]